MVIGTGVARRAAAAARPSRPGVAVVHPADRRGPARSSLRASSPASASTPHADRGARRRGSEDAVASRARCWDRLGRARLHPKSDAIVGLGGGATTDLAGWVAAAWLRGVRVVQVPTTLAGHGRCCGRRQDGHQHRPRQEPGRRVPPAVPASLCDLDALETLPAADYIAGLAEVVKCGFIADPAILDLIERDPAAARTPATRPNANSSSAPCASRPRSSAPISPSRALREILNYGHTLGHAIERAERYRWRHGAAVSVGLVYAAALARRLGRLDDATADRHARDPHRAGLPTTYRRGCVRRVAATRCASTRRRGGAGSGSSSWTGWPDRSRSTIPTPRCWPRHTRRCRSDVRTASRRSARPERTEPRSARHSASPTSTARRPTPSSRRSASAAAAELGLDVEVRQTEHEGQLLGWLHEAADERLPVVLNAGGPHPYVGRAGRRLRDAHRAAGRGAHQQRAQARAVPAPQLRLGACRAG